MQFNPPLQPAVLLKRYKRFLADVRLAEGREITLHCPNTGAMTNCQFPGETVWYSLSDNPKRKCPGTWELMQNPQGEMIGINTNRANELAEEGIRRGVISELQGYSHLRREVRYGEENSRIDILLSDDNRPDCYVEVKSATLLQGDCGYFPDAVTQRGQKHLRELMTVVEKGQRGVLMFVAQHTGIKKVAAARHIDPDYADLLTQAITHGVEVLVYATSLSPQNFQVDARLPFVTENREK
ncbi:DNA/RNA nuclease SfsA [Shewanella sp. YIC-542]|uniref:DNA/RNA nuclease SfsA n=1 Tax=Shewanella mytili TaxID=3377111 RepID=UPI00398EBF23